jgi:hypothetical protein
MRLRSDDIAPLLRVLGQPIQATEVIELRRAFALQPDKASDLTYFESSEVGIALAAKAGKVCSIFLFAQGKDGFQRYRGALPLGITFEWDQKQVRETLGAPTASGSAERITQTLVHGGWDKYSCAECYLHFTYAPGTQRIDLVTLEVAE